MSDNTVKTSPPAEGTSARQPEPDAPASDLLHSILDVSVLLSVWAAGYYGAQGGYGLKTVLTVGLGAICLTVLDSAKLMRGLADYRERFKAAHLRGSANQKTGILGKLVTAVNAGHHSGDDREWLNYTIATMWGTTIEPMLTDSVTQTLESLLEANKPAVISKLCAQTVSFGTNPPQLLDIRSFDDGKQHAGPHVLLESNFVLDTVDMNVSIGAMFGIIPITVCIHKIHVSGVVRLGIKPVCGPPYAGNVRISFAQKPMIDVKVKTMGTGIPLTEISVVDSWIDGVVLALLDSMMVEPNGVFVDLEGVQPPVQADQNDGAIGTLHVRVAEAAGLKSKSIFSTLDPYVEVILDNQSLVVPKVNRTNAPKWNRSLMFRVKEAETHTLKLRVLDWEYGPDKDDVLGQCTLDLNVDEFKKQQRTAVELPLEGCPGGKIVVKLMLSRFKDQASTEEPNLENPLSDAIGPQVTLEGGLFLVTVHSARNLTAKDLGRKASDPFVELELDGTKKRTQVVKNNLNPEWGETIELPAKPGSTVERKLKVTCYDRDLLRKKSLGSVEIPLTDKQDGQAHQDWYKLDGAESGEIRLVIVYTGP